MAAANPPGVPLSAFITSIIINSVTAFIFLALFQWLRTRAKYGHFFHPLLPARVSAGLTKVAGGLPVNPFSLVKLVISLTKEEMVHHAGVDAYLFCACLAFGVKLFAVMTVIGFVMLIPTNAVGGNKGETGLDKVAMSNIPENKRPLLWVHWVTVYAFSILAAKFLWDVSKDYVRLRNDFMKRATVGARSVIVVNVDKACSSSDALATQFKSLFPGAVTGAVMVPRPLAPVTKAVGLRDKAVNALEHALASYQKLNGHPEPGVALPKEDLVASTGVAEKRPECKDGAKCFCIGGKKVDAIRHWAGKVETTTRALQDSRAMATHVDPVGFVTFSDIVTAQTAAQTRLFGDVETQVMLAPEPQDALWTNYALSRMTRAVNPAWVRVAVWALVLFWSIPVAFVASLANLKQLSRNTGLTWLAPAVDAAPALTGALTGYAPAIVLAVFMSLLPAILGFFTKKEGAVSHSAVQLGVARKYFIFQVVNVFLIMVLSGSVFNSISDIIDNPTSIVSLLATSLPRVSNFFINYVMLQGLGGMPMGVLRLVGLIIVRIKLKYLNKTTRDKEAILASGSGSMNYASAIPGALLVTTVSLAYSSLNPVICPFAAIYFSLALFVYKYNCMFVYDKPFETGGLFWEVIVPRVVVAAILYQVTLIGILALNKAPAQTITLIPLPVASVIFLWHLQRTVLIPARFLPADTLVARVTVPGHAASGTVGANTPGTVSPSDSNGALPTTAPATAAPSHGSAVLVAPAVVSPAASSSGTTALAAALATSSNAPISKAAQGSARFSKVVPDTPRSESVSRAIAAAIAASEDSKAYVPPCMKQSEDMQVGDKDAGASKQHPVPV